MAAQSKLACAVTCSLEKAKARYPWARAWVQVKGGIWCFETKAGRDALPAPIPSRAFHRIRTREAEAAAPAS